MSRVRVALLALPLALAACSSRSTQIKLDITVASDVTTLDSVLVQLYGLHEIGTGTTLDLSGKSRMGQIVITDIDSKVRDLRILITGFSAGHVLAGQAASDVQAIPNSTVEISVMLTAGALPDGDGDGVPDVIDDCPDTADPTQTQACDSTDGGGPPPPDLAHDLAMVPTYAVGGTLTGLTGTLVLRNNGGDDLTLAADGAFAFAKRLPSGSPYAVTVRTQPLNQLCVVTNGSGSVDGADVTNVAINCVSGHNVGGTVTGLVGGMLVLRDNGGDDLTLTADGAFTFATPVQEGMPYAVTVAAQPSGQLCTLANDTGVMSTMDVTNVAVTCRKLVLAINEVYARPATGALGDTNGDDVRDSTADEFVEIMNNEPAPVDLSGWVLKTGTGTPAVRFTWPAATTLAAGARAVVFGGGIPTGSFGGAPTFSAATGLSLTDAPTSLTVSLETSGGVVLDSYTYNASTFGSSCTTTCASQVRSPEGTGAFVAHTIASGNAGVLWSPGVAATAAIPKVNQPLSVPPPGAMNVSVVANLTPQFNMFMNTVDFDNAHLKLFASPCSALANEFTTFSSIGPGLDASTARMVPSVPLAYATTYCLQIDATTASPLDVPLGATVAWELTTRAAASAPATTVVLSEVGGCRMSATSGTTACGGTGANDEFVELYNPTAGAVDVSGWFLQRRASGGSATCGATLPAGTIIQPGHFYLIGGAGYTASHYAGAPAADLLAAGSLMVGGSESVVLISNAGTCTGSGSVVDSLSAGAITDTLASLYLPAFPSGLTDGTSIERKACYNSTGDADATTGMFTAGGHELQGNSEKIRASNADFVARPTPNPQNSAAAAETRTCP